MKDFNKYFSGLDRDFGFCNIKNGFIEESTGKLKFDPGDYGWSHRPITDQDYEEHLNGETSIGIQPCDDNATASFGAIDVDPSNYTQFRTEKFLKIIDDKQLPIIPIKSKSGGLHIYIFTKEKVPATLIRECLQNLLFLFGLSSKTEIYPKQTKLGKNQHNKPISGSFINLPYFKKTERRALKPDGTEMELEEFLKVVELNLQTKESLKSMVKKKVSDILTGGPEELHDGPPCLQMICKGVQESGNKLKDERDRYLFNYMVFAKKKFPEEWKKKLLQNARDNIIYDDVWGDEKVKEKIRLWDKDTAGHTCYDLPISVHCAKGTCLRRKFGIGGRGETNWPQVTGLIKMDYKPDPEFLIDVALDSGDVVQIHAKHIKKIAEMKEMRALIASQTKVFPPLITNKEYQVILDTLWANMRTIKPQAGTSPLEILKDLMIDYVNGPKAKSHASFLSGSVHEEDGYYYMVFTSLFEELKRNDWKQDKQRTSHLIAQHFNGDFDCKKRFPKNEGDEESNPQVRCLKLPKLDLEKEEAPDEKINMEDKENIV